MKFNFFLEFKDKDANHIVVGGTFSPQPLRDRCWQWAQQLRVRMTSILLYVFKLLVSIETILRLIEYMETATKLLL
jgi:hypothetical protein